MNPWRLATCLWCCKKLLLRTATRHLVLADPTFDEAAPVDALFGADIVAAILMGETVALGSGFPRFGYVIMGEAPVALNCVLACANGLTTLPLDPVSQHTLHCHFHGLPPSFTSLPTSFNYLYSDVRKFWELEDPPCAVLHKSSD